MKAQVTVVAFLDWYFSDSESVNFLGRGIISDLKSGREVILSAQDVFDGCEYIPAFICVNADKYEEDQEFDPKEVELINFIKY